MYQLFIVVLFFLVTSVSPGQSTFQDDLLQEEVWQQIASGLERRVYFPNQSIISQLTAIRIDIDHYDLRVHYHPDEVRSTTEWLDALPEELVLFANASFYDVQRNPLGLLILNDTVITQSHFGVGGYFYRAEDEFGITSNFAELIAKSEIPFAIEGTPLLVSDGQSVYSNSYERRPARRTVIAEDENGRIVLLVTPLLGITLTELSQFLVNSDLQIVNALNLDGGRSTMLAIPSEDYQISGFDKVPVVLGVYAK